MNKTVKPWLLGGACAALLGGCALFDQETTSTDTMAAPEPAPVVDQSMQLDVNTALEQARQALEEAQTARRLAEQALSATQQALDSANACQSRCEAVEAQIERAFQQSQSK